MNRTIDVSVICQSGKSNSGISVDFCSIVGSGSGSPDMSNYYTKQQSDNRFSSKEKSVPSGGFEGQVLAKKSNDDNDLEWINQNEGGISDYEDLDNLPSINGVTLSGNKSASDLSLATAAQGAKADTALQTETDPTVPSWAKQSTKPSYDYSEIGNTPDLSGFITKNVNDLANYYLKSETYTKTEVINLIAAINQFHYEIAASTSAVTNPQSNVLYLIGPVGSGSDKYEEYVYPDSTTGWVKIGDTSIDLSGYVTTSALNTALAAYTTTSDLTTLLSNKADKCIPSTAGNIAKLTAEGNLTDGGIAASDVATTSDLADKLDAPSTAGTSGQVLTSDGQGGQSWQTPTSGVSSYNDLPDKPQINSVTLSGNKSASDLSLATAAQGAKADAIYTNYLQAGSAQGETTIPNFDAYADTVHITEQSLSSSQKTQARTNIGSQETLVSGTNIKTINNQSLLGSGNITIQGGSGTQIQSDWNQTDNSEVDYIKNKPTIPTVPTNVSSFNNDAPYLKYYLCTDETEYNGIQNKDSGTLYLIPET